MLREHIAKIRPALALLLSLLLEPFEFLDAASDLQVGGAFAAIA